MARHDGAENFDATAAGSEFDRAEQQQSANPLEDTEVGPVESVPTEADPADVNDQAYAVLPDDQPATTWVSSEEGDNRAPLGDFNPDS